MKPYFAELSKSHENLRTLRQIAAALMAADEIQLINMPDETYNYYSII